MRSRSQLFAAVGSAAAVALILSVASSVASGAPRAHRAQCSSPLSSRHDPSNPLELASPPGRDPLQGAPFFEEGPGRNRGSASNAIAGYIGRDPFSFPSMTWDAFHQYLDSRRDAFTRGQAYHIALMSKIGSEPEAHWFTSYTGGGVPGAIYTLVQQYLCRLQETDPGTVGLMTTYFLKHGGYCPTNRETPDDQAVFRRRINELIDAVGNFPVVIYFELDGIMTGSCLSHDGLLDREGLMRWAIDRLSRVPHAVVYVDGGSSDATSVGFTAGILNTIGVRKIRGFFLNGTHYNWTTDEAAYGDRVARRTGAHFVIDTRANGHGPLLTRDPVHQGIEDLCNPPGRGLGPRPVGDPRLLSNLSNYLDGFVWTGAPGKSGGTGPGCHGVSTGSGLFDQGQALMLAKHANGKLGPGYPSEPY